MNDYKLLILVYILFISICYGLWYITPTAYECQQYSKELNIPCDVDSEVWDLGCCKCTIDNNPFYFEISIFEVDS